MRYLKSIKGENMRIKYCVAAILGIFLINQGAFAIPSLNARCNIKVKAPDLGSGVMFDETCTTAYVLPPLHGSASVPNMVQNANLQFCPAVLKAGNVADKTMTSANTLADRIANMIKDFSSLDKEIQELRMQKAEAEPEYEALQEKFNRETSRSEELKEALIEAKKAYKDCTLLATDPTTECSNQSSEVENAKTAFADHLRNVLSPLEDNFLEKKQAFKKLDNKIAELSKQYTEGLTPVLDLQEKLFDLNARVLDLYKTYAPMEGVVSQVLFEVNYPSLINEYQKLNPGITFEQAPIKAGEIYANGKTPSNYDLVSLPALLWSVVPGITDQKTGAASMRPVLGPMIRLVRSSPTPPINNNVGQLNSLSGQVALSITGACNYFPKGADTTKTSMDFKAFAALLDANMKLTFEVGARRGYFAKYNMSNFFSRVEKNVKKGGFFSSTNIHSVVEDTKSNDWFEITFDQPGSSEFQYSPSEQAEITREVKGQLVDRALRNIGIASGGPSVMPGMPSQPVSGASQLASSMRKGCGFNLYCQAGGFILGTLDNIFGQTTAVSDFKRQNNAWVEERVKGAIVLDRFVTLTFVPPTELQRRANRINIPLANH